MKVEHKGLILVQEEKENHHYMIFTDKDDGELLFHASYEGEVFTEEQAREKIENYLKLQAMIEGSEKILQGDENEG